MRRVCWTVLGGAAVMACTTIERAPQLSLDRGGDRDAAAPRPRASVDAGSVPSQGDDSGGSGGGSQAAGGAGGAGGEAAVAGSGGAGTASTGSDGGSGGSSGAGGSPPDVGDPWWEELPHDEVYLLAAREYGQCSGALTRLNNMSNNIAGFLCSSEVRYAVHDGKLLYSDLAGNVRRWVPDDSTMGYPTAPLDNDPVLDTKCPGEVTQNLVPGAESGALAYYCDGAKKWYDYVSGAELMASSSKILAINADGVGFVDEGTMWGVVDFVQGRRLDWDPRLIVDVLQNLARIRRTSMRGHGTGFHFVVTNAKDWELWEVMPNTDWSALTTTMVGTYPENPINTDNGTGHVFLTADDTLYNGTTKLIRRTLDGDSEVVYDELKADLKLELSSIIGGK